MESRCLAVPHVVNTMRFLESCWASFLVSIVTRSEVCRPCHYSHNRATSCFGCTLDCFVCWGVWIGCWPLPFCSLSSSQRSCEIFWCWSALRLGPLTFPSAAIICMGEPCDTPPPTHTRPRANHQPFSEPLKANTLQTWVTEDNDALAHEKKT